MTFAATLLTLVLTKGGALLPFADEVIEVHVEGTPLAEVRALLHQVRIAGAGAKARGWKMRGLCPRAHAEGVDLILDCTSSHLHARSTSGVVLVYRLRGLPWAAKDDPLPHFYFSPEQVGLGGPCPGTTPAGKAECALAAGQIAEARTQLDEAMKTPNRDYAGMRLADLALEADQPLEALGLLEKAEVGGGAWARLALIRECELTARCGLGISRAALFDTAGMAAAQRKELSLRELRILRFESAPTAVARLFVLGGGSWPDALCKGTVICNNVLHDALETDDVEGRVTALALFASGPVSMSGPTRPGVANAAADAAAALGAPQYAAAVLAAATPDVVRADLPAHLRRIMQLYFDAGQPARSAAVLAYAIDTLGPQIKQEAAWKKLQARAAGVAVEKEAVIAVFPTADAELAKELALATIARSHAGQTR